MLKRASKLDVRCQTFAMYAVDAPPRAGLIPGYGSIDAGDIEEGLHRQMQTADHSAVLFEPVGCEFRFMNGTQRNQHAAFAASGELLGWAPRAGNVRVGGSFTQVDGHVVSGLATLEQ